MFFFVIWNFHCAIKKICIKRFLRCQRCKCSGAWGVYTLVIFFKWIKVPFFCLWHLFTIISKHVSKEIRKGLAIFFSILNLKILFQYMSSLKYFNMSFLWIRPLPAKSPCCALDCIYNKYQTMAVISKVFMKKTDVVAERYIYVCVCNHKLEAHSTYSKGPDSHSPYPLKRW